GRRREGRVCARERHGGRRSAGRHEGRVRGRPGKERTPGQRREGRLTPRSGGASGWLLRSAVLFLIAWKAVHGRNAHDLLAGSLPGLLDDPRERAILTGRLGPDLL